MALPTQIDGRLAAVGASTADVDERFVRGVGLGGQKIKLFKLISTVPWSHPDSSDEQDN
jgi:hypothetical protein